MYPYISIFGKQFTTYGVFAVIGISLAILYCFIIHKVTKDKKDFFSRFIFIFYGVLVGGVGAAILYQLTNIKNIITGFQYLFSEPKTFLSYISFGIVFYGGMIGMFIGFMVYSKVFKEDTRGWIRNSIPGMPLFHTFGRIGCAVGGCCFGVAKISHGVYNAETHIYEIGDAPVFSNGCIYNARIGQYCIPVQLIESAFLFLIFIIVLIYVLKQKDKNAYYRPMGLYFVLYAVLRFIDEFWRGDLYRGIWGPFSTSQYISLIIFPIGLYCLFCPTEKSIFEKWYNGTFLVDSDK